MSRVTQVPGTYDVDAEVKKMIPTDVRVAGHTFLIKRSGKALRKVVALNPQTSLWELDANGKRKLDENGDPIAAPPEDIDTDQDIRLLYESLSFLFVDPVSGRAPKIDTLLPKEEERDEGEEYPDTFAEWLEEEMDVDAAQDLLSRLVPAGGDEANPTVPVSAQVS